MLVVIVTASALHTSFRLSGRDDALAEAKRKLAAEQAEQKKLEEIKNSVNSAEFIEREARDKLGLAKEGETVVVLPPPETLKKLAPVLPVEEEGLGEVGLPVWRQWTKLLWPELDQAFLRG